MSQMIFVTCRTLKKEYSDILVSRFHNKSNWHSIFPQSNFFFEYIRNNEKASLHFALGPTQLWMPQGLDQDHQEKTYSRHKTQKRGKIKRRGGLHVDLHEWARDVQPLRFPLLPPWRPLSPWSNALQSTVLPMWGPWGCSSSNKMRRGDSFHKPKLRLPQKQPWL